MAEVFEKEITKLQRMNPAGAEFSVQYNHVSPAAGSALGRVQHGQVRPEERGAHPDRDHFGLEKVKERIIEHLAVLKLKGDMKAPSSACMGLLAWQTSLGKSMAEALGRKYVRMSLGGLHDEAEIRGSPQDLHRRDAGPSRSRA